MIMKVLQNKAEINISRQRMKKEGVSCIESKIDSFIRRVLRSKSILIGDYLKSWDVLSTLDFIKINLDKKQSILDIGCFSSEVIVCLKRLGYINLSGVDLNPDVGKMPYSNFINYEISDFLQTPFDSASFDAITAISVVEHGLNEVLLLKEISRLLRKGGYFILSFDYWPDKVNTDGIKFFGLDWIIFSREEVNEFIKSAREFGLNPIGDLNQEASSSPIQCGGRNYTFGWLVLQKGI